MNARLFCKTGALAGSEYHIGEETTIGRWEENDITLPPDAVSGRHARIFFDANEKCYVLEDLDSRNGTRLDDSKVIDPVPLKDLHIITFAEEVDFIFQAAGEETAPSSTEEEVKTQFGVAPESPSTLPGEDEPEGEKTRVGGMPGKPPDLPDEESASETEGDATEDEDRTRFGETPPELPDLSEEPSGDKSDDEKAERTRMEADAPALPDLPESNPSSEEEERETVDEAPSPAEPSPQYALQVVVEGGPEDTHALSEGEVTIGRSPDCDIRIEDPGVSRQHAQLTVESDEVVLKDMGSKNFTFVDGDRLSGPTVLSPGTEIQFGLQAKAVLRHGSS